MNSRVKTKRICIAAFGMAINIICPFIAAGLRLPIYMDSIGTIFVTTILGFKYGALAGVAGSLISGFTFDIYSLYYFPVQIITAYMTELSMKNNFLNGKKIIFGGLIVSFPTAIVSSVITAFVFGGITSSGSSYIVALLRSVGLSLTASCVLVQIFTEYLDKTMAVVITKVVLKKGAGVLNYGKIQ